jgi:hypothetical protein
MQALSGELDTNSQRLKASFWQDGRSLIRKKSLYLVKNDGRKTDLKDYKEFEDVIFDGI